MQTGLRRKRVHYAEDAVEGAHCARCGATIAPRSAPLTLESIIGREMLVLAPGQLTDMRFESMSCLYSTLVDELPRRRALHLIVQESAERRGLACAYIQARPVLARSPVYSEPDPVLDFSWIGTDDKDVEATKSEGEEEVEQQQQQQPDVVMASAEECGASAASSEPL